MGKLFNLKEWLTVADAAQHLSIVFGEDVTEADVLRLGLDGHLRLSVYFVNHAKARCGKVIPWEETDWWLFPDSDDLPGGKIMKWGEQLITNECRPCPTKLAALYNEYPVNEHKNYCPMMLSLNIDGERFLTLDKTVTTLRGVWDLPMIGNEQLDIEHYYQNLTGGPGLTLQGLDGAFVEGSDGRVCQLQEHFDENEYQSGSSAQLERLEQHIADNNIKGAEAESLLNRHKEKRKEFLEKQRTRPTENNYYPAWGLPEDAVIVVRTKALREFEQSVNGAPNGTEKPIAASERYSLLTIIAALCEYSSIKLQERGAASQIAKLTEEIGAAVSDDTVRRVLARIPDALESRMK
ncbi:hypothetical protein [Propionivibrio sp.]|uniref:hypothetical protein n=1 Tax=Propionivibrio sp. TaxID=2212460 RepID=UPI0039E63CEF